MNCVDCDQVATHAVKWSEKDGGGGFTFYDFEVCEEHKREHSDRAEVDGIPFHAETIEGREARVAAEEKAEAERVAAEHIEKERLAAAHAEDVTEPEPTDESDPAGTD